MKAITITQEVKDKNKLFKNRAVDTIYRGLLPNKFWGVERVVGGYVERTDLHQADGWHDIVTPTITDTEKLGALYFDATNEVFTYPVLNKTAEELEQARQAEQEQEKQKIKEAKLEKLAEEALTPEERLKWYKEWIAGSYSIGDRVVFKGKTFENTITDNTNAPDKGGWIEIK